MILFFFFSSLDLCYCGQGGLATSLENDNTQEIVEEPVPLPSKVHLLLILLCVEEGRRKKEEEEFLVLLISNFQ